MRTELDFSDYVPVRRKLGWTIMLLSTIGLLCVCGATLHVRQKIERTEQMLRQPITSEPNAGAEALARSIKEARVISSALRLPWDSVLGDIEAAANDDIALLQLSIRPLDGTVSMVGLSRDMGALLAYSRRLGASNELAAPYIVRQEIHDPSSQLPLRFELAARWGIFDNP
ncbi:MAG TPA: hypothetical protein VGE57_09075 [Solimonas sp.]